MSMTSNLPPPYTEVQKFEYDKENKVLSRVLGNTSCDYRRCHVEVWVNLDAGESVFDVPLKADAQGTIRTMRVRSRSEKVKVTLTSAPGVYTKADDDPHPRSIIIQETTEKKDMLYDYENVYVYIEREGNPLSTYISIENLGADSDGISVIFTFGY